MTNHWNDIKNSNCILIMGSNAAENHPISFKWVTEAMTKRGAKLISVDPRFTRTSSKADIFAQIRPGTDIAFINGLINYAIENELYNEEYMKNYTNALCKINENFDFDTSTGLFSDFTPGDPGSYDKTTWKYQLTNDNNVFAEDLNDANCVFQLLKEHVSRYTPEKVEQITGVSQAKFNEIADAYCATGARDKVGTIMYAMGWTQHTVGVQNIRAMAVLQLILGNIGLAGGGVNALRGESNVQGSTDHTILYHYFPGYLASSNAKDVDLATYVGNHAPAKINGDKSANYWGNYKKFMVSLLKDYFGDNAQEENEFCYSYLPKKSGDYSHISLFEAMHAGTIKGLICMGQNPAVGGPNAEFEREALEKLDWLIAADLWETETASFWYRDGVDPSTIQTEVFLLPAASSFEKDGSITNSGRWAQWRYKAVNPPGVAKSDLWILGKLGQMLKLLHLTSSDDKDNPIKHLDWNYGIGKDGGPNVEEVAKRINGKFMEDKEIGGVLYNKGTQVPNFTKLQDDGSTSSANWLYCGCYPEEGNMAARRDFTDNSESGIGLYSNWSWCWPVNRRIIYNRASCDVNGDPWDESRKVIWWDGSDGEWKGGDTGDVPDYGKTTPPSAGLYPFIMKPEGLGRLFGMGRVDGPMPEHYEPLETPLSSNPMGHSQLSNPCIRTWPGNVVGDASQYPYVATTYRLTEHWQAGAMTRNLPWLCELVPDMFCEISETLAVAKGIQSGDKVKVSSARGEITAYALVTDRIKTLTINGSTKVEIVGLPWHFGYRGIATGENKDHLTDSANSLTPHVGDPNTTIPEYKAFLVNIEKI